MVPNAFVLSVLASSDMSVEEIKWHIGFEQHERKWWHNLNLGVKYPCNGCKQEHCVCKRFDSCVGCYFHGRVKSDLRGSGEKQRRLLSMQRKQIRTSMPPKPTWRRYLCSPKRFHRSCHTLACTSSHPTITFPSYPNALLFPCSSLCTGIWFHFYLYFCV